MEDLHKTLIDRMGPYRYSESGAKTAMAYSTFTSGLTNRKHWLEYEIKEIKTKVEFFGQTGFPDFPLGTSVYHYSTMFFIQLHQLHALGIQ